MPKKKLFSGFRNNRRLYIGVLVMISAVVAYSPCNHAVAQDSAVYAGRPKPPAGPYPFPEARYTVRLNADTMVPMRDGVRLATDFYFPEGTPGKLPVIYIATPYGKGAKGVADYTGVARFFAGQGYVVALQDVRGKHASEGDFVVEHAVGRDAYDTVNWMVLQPWSNGAVGTYGCSYMGEVQVYGEKYPHPAVKARVVQATGGIAGEARPDGMNGPRLGGALMLGDALPWLRNYMAKYGKDKTPLPKIDYDQVVTHLPMKTMMVAAGNPWTDWIDYVGRDYSDPYWKTFNIVGEGDPVTTPAIHVNSWFDYGVSSSIYVWKLFQNNAVSPQVAQNQYLIISPTEHCGSESVPDNFVVGDFPAGDPRLDFWSLYLDWFDHWLRNGDSAVTKMPRIQFYTTGMNAWNASADWPLPGTRYVNYYFHSDGRANSVSGDGRLDLHPPANKSSDAYNYDPANPVRTSARMGKSFGVGPHSDEDAARQQRKDVLVYTSSPLERNLNATGPMEVVLYVSSDAKDTDFCGWLSDVDEEGRSFDIDSGIMRARYRQGYDHQVFFRRRKVYEVRVSLRPSSHVFKAGHRIRVSIASSNFPRFDRNLNTGGDNFTETRGVVAHNIVHHSSIYPSHLVLPSIGP